MFSTDTYLSVSEREAVLKDYLASVGAKLPPMEFIEVTSNLYHKFEAAAYDSRHSEIFDSPLSASWQNILKRINESPRQALSVLDIGCGTGFATKQVLAGIGAEKIQKIVCADPSKEMLIECKNALSAYPVEVEYLEATIDDLSNRVNQFDIVVCNSVLHHVFELEAFLDIVARLVKPGGFYIVGHEPAASAMQNAEIQRYTRLFRNYSRVRKNLNLRRLASRLKRRLLKTGGTKTILEKVNDELLSGSYIKTKLDPLAITKMVDIHVPTMASHNFSWGFLGLEPKWIAKELEFDLLLTESYNHLKHIPASDAFWQGINRSLAEKYPQQGVDFIALYQKPVAK